MSNTFEKRKSSSNTLRKSKNLWKTSSGVSSVVLFSFLVATLLTPASSALMDSGFFVKAQNRENSEIKAFAGVKKTPFEPGGESPENGSDTQLRSYSCGNETVVITQAMEDLSNKNKELRSQGKFDEMVAHPTGGWFTMIDYGELDPSSEGVAFSSKEGGVGFDQLVNLDGWSIATVSKNNDSCIFFKTSPEGLHSTDGPARIDFSRGVFTEHWYENGEMLNVEGRPWAISYYGSLPSEQVFLENYYDKVKDPEWRLIRREYDKTGKVVDATFSRWISDDNWRVESDQNWSESDPIPQDLWDKAWSGR